MNQWVFVVAAYLVTAAGTAGLVAWAYVSMRRGEAAADALKRR